MAKTPRASKPAIEATNPPLGDEIGRVGLKGAIPYGGFLWEEIIPELRGQNGAKAYRKMADNDPVSNSIIYAFEALLRGVPWTVEPNPTAPKGQAAAAADFVRAVLFEDMEASFGDVISEALSELTYGFSLQEIILKVRDGRKDDPRKTSRYKDQYIGLAALAPRSQETIWRWQYGDGGRLIGAHQQLPDGGHSTLPVSRLLHFTTVSRLQNPEGRSLLRGAYTSFIRRNTIEQAMGRVAIRTAGIVDIRVPARMLRNDADDQDKAALAGYKGIAERVAQDRQGGIIIPSDTDEHGNPLFDFKYTIPDPRRPTDLLGLFQEYNKLIAMTLLGDFLFLGSTAVGSRALADPKMEMFTKAMEAIVKGIAEEFQRGLLPNLWAWNGFDFEVMPTLQPGSVSSPDLTAFASALSALVGAGMQFFPDPATENKVRQYLLLPPVSEESGGEESMRGPGAELSPDFKDQPLEPPGNGKMGQQLAARIGAATRFAPVAPGTRVTPGGNGTGAK